VVSRLLLFDSMQRSLRIGAIRSECQTSLAQLPCSRVAPTFDCLASWTWLPLLTITLAAALCFGVASVFMRSMPRHQIEETVILCVNNARRSIAGLAQVQDPEAPAVSREAEEDWGR
jgi:hypothetical protein